MENTKCVDIPSFFAIKVLPSLIEKVIFDDKS